MTKFVKEQFEFHGGYLTYFLDPMPCAWDRRKFVARFKYVKGNRAGFQKFLIANFTVEEYLGRLEAGETPLAILESKGYLDAHIVKQLKAEGLPLVKESVSKLIEIQRERYEATKGVAA